MKEMLEGIESTFRGKISEFTIPEELYQMYGEAIENNDECGKRYCESQFKQYICEVSDGDELKGKPLTENSETMETFKNADKPESEASEQTIEHEDSAEDTDSVMPKKIPSKSAIHFLGSSFELADAAKKVEDAKRSVHEWEIKVENAESKIRQYDGFLRSDIKNGRDTTLNKNNLIFARRQLEDSQKNYDNAKNKYKKALQEYSRLTS